MQEHPVPQNVTSYEFHLIGNMTLKQFLELGIGAAFGFIAYQSNLPGILKWPLVLVGIIGGIAFAFVPLQERPLDQWFLAFIRAIYNPTKFFWRKEARIPELFVETPASKTIAAGPITTMQRPHRGAKVQAYFESISPSYARDPYEEELFQRAQSVSDLYAEVPAAKNVISEGPRKEDPFEKPSMKTEIHELHAQEDLLVAMQTEQAPTTDGAQEYARILTAEVVLPTSVASQNLVNQTVEPAGVGMINKPPSGEVILPDQGTSSLKIAPKPNPLASPEAQVAHVDNKGQFMQNQANIPKTNPTAEPVKSAETDKSLPFPKTPTQPNIVVGMVLNNAGKIIENAIVEIRTLDGFPARALRSNKLGQFFTSSPLPSGDYDIVVEKEGFTFEKVRLVVKKNIVPPIAIRAA